MKQKAMPAGRQGFIYILPLVALLLIVAAGSLYYLNKKKIITPPVSPSPSASTTDTIEGKPCGGFFGEKGEYACPSGYYCQYPEPMYPDAQGKCVKKENDDLSSTCVRQESGDSFVAMNKDEADKIANNSECSKFGAISLSSGRCNNGSWEFTIESNLENCDSACVINPLTKKAIIKQACY